MTGYALLGGVAGGAGLLVQGWITDSWVRWFLGGATILVAIGLFLRHRTANASCKHKPDASSKPKIPVDQLRKTTPLVPSGLFFMGMGMALNPCAPLTTVIFAATATASALAGLSLGMGFGLGAVIIPTLLFAFGVAHFGTQVREHLERWRGALEKTSIGFLLLMGVSTAIGWIAV